MNDLYQFLFQIDKTFYWGHFKVSFIEKGGSTCSDDISGKSNMELDGQLP